MQFLTEYGPWLEQTDQEADLHLVQHIFEVNAVKAMYINKELKYYHGSDSGKKPSVDPH